MNLSERAMKVGDAIACLNYDRDQKEKYTESERCAVQLLAGIVGVMPEEVVFLDTTQLEKVRNQVIEKFEEDFELVTLRGDDSVVFFYGRLKRALKDGCKDGIWKFNKCCHCGAPSIYGVHIHNFHDIRLAPRKGGPWWHKAFCDVITPSLP